MVQCQCIKTDGKKCTREVSTKVGDNHMYCWQHQKCQTGKLTKPAEIKLKSEMKFPNLAQWIKNNLFKGGLNNGYEYLPDKFYDELGYKAYKYIETKTQYMYDFWDVILHISPFPAWIEKPSQLDYIYELMQKNDTFIYELRVAFEKDGGHLPYSKDIYTEDDLPPNR